MKDQVPRASVIIVSWNSREHLQTCLNSLLEHRGDDCEVVLLDNNSVDGSADFVEQSYPWVHLVRSQVNCGFAAGNNRAVAASSGSYVVGLNPDTEVTAGWLDALLRPLEGPRNGRTGSLRVGLTTPRLLMMQNHDIVNACGDMTHYTGITICRGFGQRSEQPEFARAREVSVISGACFALSRALWDELHGFDSNIFAYLEDTDLSLRARTLGYGTLYVPDAIVYHRYGNSFPASKFYYLERNRELMILKVFSARTILLMLPALLLTECITWAFALWKGPAYIAEKVRAYAWLIAHAPTVIAAHNVVQRRRTLGDSAILQALTRKLDFSQLLPPGAARLAGVAANPLFILVRMWLGR